MSDVLEKIVKEHAWMNYIKPTYWDGKFHKDPSEVVYRKISLCTTCMNRAEDLKRTLPKNIEFNFEYPNIEFVVINYNSEDDLDDWMKSEMSWAIEKGILNYYHTREPEYYSMTHSRNIAFKVAEGDIVNNVDSDCYTNKGFASYINLLSNELPEKAIFAKGRKMLRGRLGFYREDFIELLGGYDEDLKGYGHDDHDLMHRAWGLGFRLAWFGGDYHVPVDGHKKHQGKNYQHESWRYTEKRNKVLSFYNIAVGKFKANEGHHWGKAALIKNFNDLILV